eukprot:4492359-Pleurochrysis_carterae.AAC.1
MPQRTAHLPTNALLFRSQLGRTSYTEGKLLLTCPVCNCRRQLLNAEESQRYGAWCPTRRGALLMRPRPARAHVL